MIQFNSRSTELGSLECLNAVGFTLVSGFKSFYKPAVIRCRLGHIFSARIENIFQSKSCPICAANEMTDVVYFAKTDAGICKFGVTKLSRIFKRLREISSNGEYFRLDLIAAVRTLNSDNARLLEKELLSKFPKPKNNFNGVEGRGEFRVLTKTEINIVEKNFENLNKLNSIMREFDLSAKQVSELVYVTQDSVYKWLRGSNPVDEARLELLEYKLERNK